MATIKTNEDQQIPPVDDNGAQYVITSVVITAVVILILIVLVKFFYFKRLSGKNYQNARRIRTLSETVADRPPPYVDIQFTTTTFEDGTIQIYVPESPPYIKDPPPYTM